MIDSDTYRYKSNILFNTHHLDFIINVCKPLQNIGISTFAYVRMYNNGRQLCLTNNLEYINFCLMYDYVFRTKFFQVQYHYFSKHKSYKIIWPNNVDDDLINGLRNRNICQGFNLTQYSQGVLETCFFGSTADNEQVHLIYHKHAELLEKFRNYFVNCMASLIDHAENYHSYSPHAHLIIPNIDAIFHEKTVREEGIHEFLRTLNTSQRFVKCRTDTIFLSKRELECLSYLSIGRSIKEIAQILFIKPRTVEKHMENIRYKTSYHNKTDLIHWYEDNIQWN